MMCWARATQACRRTSTCRARARRRAKPPAATGSAAAPSSTSSPPPQAAIRAARTTSSRASRRCSSSASSSLHGCRSAALPPCALSSRAARAASYDVSLALSTPRDEVALRAGGRSFVTRPACRGTSVVSAIGHSASSAQPCTQHASQ